MSNEGGFLLLFLCKTVSIRLNKYFEPVQFSCQKSPHIMNIITLNKGGILVGIRKGDQAENIFNPGIKILDLSHLLIHHLLTAIEKVGYTPFYFLTFILENCLNLCKLVFDNLKSSFMNFG